ncbi:MAG: DUF3352 domain-containing protein [Scytonema sp. PMC 1069.18]|nr:DUF3352 domain-containing protein [Scytonema sp. PMC 1069.18]MEC4883150.1 DUF3352 domain-containing protein [Scytonema sp. PMC 1070.18]
MTQRLFFRSLAVGILVLLLIGIAGCNRLFAKSPLNLTSSYGQPTAAIFVSRTSPVMVSLLVNPENLEVLEGDGELSKLKTRLFANTGIDYQHDIQPWLGNEITLAVTHLDIDRDPANGQQPGYLMVLATQQPEQSREFVEVLFSKRTLAGRNLTVEQYKGVKLIYDTLQEETPKEEKRGGYYSTPNRQSKSKNSQPNIQSTLAGASVGKNFVLFANDPRVLRDAINNVQAVELNLTNSNKYQQAIKQLPQNALAVAFLNLPQVIKWQGLGTDAQTYESQIVSFVEQPQGLLAESVLLTQDEFLPPSIQLSNPVGALQYLPSEVSFAVSSSDLSRLDNSNLAVLWRQVTATIFSSEKNVFSQLFLPLADAEKSWGINWKEDIFSWVQGEYAIGLLPREDKPLPDWIFVAEKSDSTPAAIYRLDAIASSNGLSRNSLTLDDQKIFAWTELNTTPTTSPLTKDRELFTIQAKVLGTYTEVGNYEIFASSIEAMNRALTAKENSLVNNSSFQEGIAVLPQTNQGYVYLDWTNSQELLERQLPVLKLVEVIGKPFFQNLRSLTVSSYGSNVEMLKGGVFFQFN